MQTVHDILTEIRTRHGILTPEIVREEARPEDSPIHAYVFNLETEDAAEEYYLERAHRLIQSARVTMRDGTSEQPRRVRAFLAIPSEQARYVYEPIADVVNDPEKFRRARMEVERRLRDAETALDDLDTLARETPNAKASKRAARAVKEAREIVSAMN